jgi:hypothetical protein
MASRPPKERVIQISLDYKNQFQYTDILDGKDASVLILIEGDRLTWTLHPIIEPRTFQLDFGVVNPFTLGSAVSLRGRDSIVAPPLKFPFKTYTSNRFLKYTVWLGNGWSDDPDVVPSPGDPVIVTQLFNPSTAIDWVDPTTQSQITLTPPAMTADATGGGGLAQTNWLWQGGAPNPQPFTLQFVAPIPPGWPSTEQDSTVVNGIPSIQLYLPKGLLAATAFNVTTTTKDGEDTSAQGTLLIS